MPAQIRRCKKEVEQLPTNVELCDRNTEEFLLARHATKLPWFREGKILKSVNAVQDSLMISTQRD